MVIRAVRGQILGIFREMASKETEYWRLNWILKRVLKDSTFCVEKLGGCQKLKQSIDREQKEEEV